MAGYFLLGIICVLILAGVVSKLRGNQRLFR